MARDTSYISFVDRGVVDKQAGMDYFLKEFGGNVEAFIVGFWQVLAEHKKINLLQ